MNKHLFTSESVTEGHPDKICDQISDAILDKLIEEDSNCHVACEVAITTNLVLVMGEITANANINIDNIVRNQRITRVPKAQSYYKGVINLRGEIIPVMSIRLKLGLEDDNYTDKTRIIIIKVDGATIGVIVDQVKEVVTLESTDIETVARSGSLVGSGYISAIGKSNDELISLLDIVALIEES